MLQIKTGEIYLTTFPMIYIPYQLHQPHHRVHLEHESGNSNSANDTAEGDVATFSTRDPDREGSGGGAD